MASRPALLVVVALAVVLGGCLGTSAPSEGPADDPPADDAQHDPVGDLIGHPAGIDTSTLPDPSTPGTLHGQVYDVGNGDAIAGAHVFVTCLRAELVPGFTALATSNETGGFALAGTGAFTDCTQVTYEIQAAGFTLAVPLASGPLADGTATFVHGGLVQTTLPGA